MFFFLGGGTGIAFLLLGPFMIIGGLRRPRDRRRLVYSGIGSIVVGLGNLLTMKSVGPGLVVIALGLYVIYRAARMGAES